jgi:hypothetical protein
MDERFERVNRLYERLCAERGEAPAPMELRYYMHHGSLFLMYVGALYWLAARAMVGGRWRHGG